MRIRWAKREGVVAKKEGGGLVKVIRAPTPKRPQGEKKGPMMASDRLHRAVVNFINEINEAAEG